MNKVFIGGSRRLSRLNSDVTNFIDRIIEVQQPVIIGDANGADKAVQHYLASQEYSNVEVYCTEGVCRNNVGDWKIRSATAPSGKRDFNYYAAKDRLMSDEASEGFMFWDGKSLGTLAQMFRLVSNKKNVTVYIAPLRRFESIKDDHDWTSFLELCPEELKQKFEKQKKSEKQIFATTSQQRLL